MHMQFHLRRAVRKGVGGGAAADLVEGLVQVLLQGDLGVKQARRLADLAVGKVGDDLADELDDLQVVQVGQEPGGLGKQEVADEHRDPRAVQRVHRVLAWSVC